MGFPLFLSLLASLGTGWAQVCDHNETCDAVDTSLIQTDSTERKQGRKHGRHGRSLQPSLLQSDQAILNEAQVQALKRPDRWHGVNYGNRFVPEDWIEYPYNFFENVTKFGPRVALWDLPPGQASKERMLTWLETSIQESHFAEMQRMAVELMRLPVGYWNFVTYPENTGPVVPQHFEERVKNLHKIATPEEYRPYLDKVFNWASKYGIKVLLDFHALPGSQNGEIHSGVCMRDSAGKNTDFFQNDANAAKALETIREMARYTKDKDALWGIQVINEPHLFNSEEHSFLKKFFEDACKLIRDEGIAMEKPCVVFSWTYDMDKWIDWNNPMFPKETYGRVIFDTHLYHFPDGTWTLDQAKASYKDDLISTRRFFLDAQIDLIVGEYTLAGTGLGPSDQKAFAQWLVDEFDFTAVGSIFWTFDCQHDDWSLVKTDHNVNWAQIWRSDRDDCISYNQINLQSADWRFLSKGGGENPKMKPSAQNWEVWHTCYQKEPAQTPGAVKMSFRSIADGGYLSVTLDRQVRGSWIRQGWETFEALCDAQARCKLKSFHGTWLSPSANYEDPDVWAVAADPPNAPQWHAISH